MSHFPKVDTFVSKRGPSALELAFKRLEEAFIAKQEAFHALVVRAQGRDGEGSFLICSDKSCCAVPSLEALRKNGKICPTCSGGLVERRAHDRVRDEAESDGDMDADECRARGVASKRGTPFGSSSLLERARRDHGGAMVDGRRIASRTKKSGGRLDGKRT